MHINKICALYCRLSRDDEDVQGDSNSIINQKARLSQYAKEKGFANPSYFIDDGVSGSTFQRPGFQAMLKEIEAGNVAVCIVKDMSRFGRNYLEVGMYTEITFPQHGVRFIAIDDNVDSENGMENDLTPFRNVFNEWFCRDTSKKIRAVKHAKAKAGKPTSTRAPYGYRASPEDKNQWIVDEEAAEIVREIFKRTLAGEGAFAIATDLVERGIDSPEVVQRKKHNLPPKHPPTYWAGNVVEHILANRAYLGTLITHKETTVSYKNRKRIFRPESEWCVTENHHAPLIDVMTFEAVQRLKQNRRRHTKMGDMGPLNGLIYCADCNAKLNLMRATSMPHEYFICSAYRSSGVRRKCTRHSIRRDELEQLILEDLRIVVDFVKNREDEFVRLMRNSSQKAAERTTKIKRNEHAKAEERIAALDVIIQRIYEDNVSGKLSDDRFAKLLATYEAEQATLASKAAALKTELDAIQKQADNIDHFLELTKQYSEVAELTAEIARSYIEKIVVYESIKTPGTKYRERQTVTQDVDVYYMYLGKNVAKILTQQPLNTN